METKTTPVAARIPNGDLAALRQIAERNDSTVSKLVARCVREQLPRLPVAEPRQIS